MKDKYQRGESYIGYILLLLLFALVVFAVFKAGIVSFGSPQANDADTFITTPGVQSSSYWDTENAEYVIGGNDGVTRTVIVESEVVDEKAIPKVVLLEDVYDEFSSAVDYEDLKSNVVAKASAEFEAGQMTTLEMKNRFGWDISHIFGKETLVTGIFTVTAEVDLHPLLDEDSYTVNGDIITIRLPRAKSLKPTLIGLREVTDLEKGMLWSWGALNDEVWIPASAINGLIAAAESDLKTKRGDDGTTLEQKLIAQAQEEAKRFTLELYRPKTKVDLLQSLVQSLIDAGYSDSEANPLATEAAEKREITILVVFD